MKRFNTPEEIEAVIDLYHKQMFTLSAMADEKEHLADQLRGTDDAYRIEGLRQSVERLRKQVLWREARLETLSERLATIRTPMFSVICADGDASIPSV